MEDFMALASSPLLLGDPLNIDMSLLHSRHAVVGSSHPARPLWPQRAWLRYSLPHWLPPSLTSVAAYC